MHDKPIKVDIKDYVDKKHSHPKDKEIKVARPSNRPIRLSNR